MKVQPIASPHAMTQTQNTTNNTAARAKAIALIAGATQPAQAIVPNQNAISPEEVGALKHATTGQSSTNEEVAVSTEIPADSVLADELDKKPEQDPALSRQFAQIARQERALRAKAQQQDAAFKAKEAALAAREAELAAKQPDLSQYIPKDRIKQDFLGVMAEEGVSYDALTQQILNQQPKDPRVEATISRLESKIKALEEQNNANKQSAQEQQTQAYQAAVKQIRMDVNSLVDSDPNFETIKATRSTKDVVDLITQTYDKDGILLSVEDAAQQVEDYLVEEAMNLTKIGKIKKKLGMTSSTPPKPAATPNKSADTKQPMKTLTNAASSSRQLSARERALLAFKGELKS